MASLRAGVARVPLELPPGIEMMGYGARQGVASGEHDPLFARALFLEAGTSLILVELDVCLIAVPQAETLRERIAARTGVARDRILVGAIHTHSGPETGFSAHLRGLDAPGHALHVFDVAVEAAATATRRAEPARLGLGRAEARIGRNRRVEDGPLDPEVFVARVDDADGSPRAILYVHGCHPTVLGHENLQYSADWPGAASRVIESRLPDATALFGLGAHADVDPRTRGLLDLAIAGQSVGAGFEAMETLGREVGEAVADAACSVETCADTEIAAASTRVAIPVHGAEAGEDERRSRLARQYAETCRALELGEDAEPTVSELFGLTHERTRHLSRDEARMRIAVARRYLRDRTAPRFAGGLRPRVEAQLLRLGDAWLLGLPAEATVEVGLDWKRLLGGAPGAVLSIANGWLRYLPHPRNFAEPDADEKYEILMSTLVPEAAMCLLDAADSLRRDLT